MAPYVERCLNSVIQQTFQPTECIIVDDASVDESIAICQRLIDEYKGPTRFFIIHHEHNRGLSAARNTGADAATSDYIYYLDSDDEMTPDCLEKMVTPVMRDDSVEIVMGEYARDASAMQTKNKTLSRTCFFENFPIELKNNAEMFDWFYKGNSQPTSAWNKLLKLSFLKEYKLFFREGLLWEDFLWYFHLIRSLNHVVFVYDVTYIYHIHSSSIVTSSKREVRLQHHGYIHKEIADLIEPGIHIKEAELWLRNFCLHYIDAAGYPDYQYAYNVYLRKFTDAKNQSAIRFLKMTHFLSKNKMGRKLFKKAIGGNAIRRIGKALFSKKN